MATRQEIAARQKRGFNPKSRDNLVQYRGERVAETSPTQIGQSAVTSESSVTLINQDVARNILSDAAPDAARLLAQLVRSKRTPVKTRMEAAKHVLEASGAAKPADAAQTVPPLTYEQAAMLLEAMRRWQARQQSQQQPEQTVVTVEGEIFDNASVERS